MANEVVEVLIEGGKATAAPPLGPALGPMGVNIGKVVADINNKTADFKGMQVPVKVTINTETKEYTISVGTPPASQLIIKEAGINKGSSMPNEEFVADLKIEQVIKIAKMKEDALLGKTNKEKVKEILGTCQSMGIMVEGKPVRDFYKDLETGKYDKKIEEGKTELSEEELKQLEAEKKKMQEELKEKREEYMNKAKEIIAKLKESSKEPTSKEIRNALHEQGIPMPIIDELAPEEKEQPKKK